MQHTHASCNPEPLAPSTVLALFSLLGLTASYLWVGLGVARIVRFHLPAVLGALSAGI